MFCMLFFAKMQIFVAAVGVLTKLSIAASCRLQVSSMSLLSDETVFLQGNILCVWRWCLTIVTHSPKNTFLFIDTRQKSWYNCCTNTEVYRSGHNEAVLKTVWVQAHGGSNPSTSANQNLNRTLAVWFRFFVCKNEVRIGVFRLLASKNCRLQVFVQKVISFRSTIEIRAFQSKNPT